MFPNQNSVGISLLLQTCHLLGPHHPFEVIAMCQVKCPPFRTVRRSPMLRTENMASGYVEQLRIYLFNKK